jgi:hypothetical protein
MKSLSRLAWRTFAFTLSIASLSSCATRIPRADITFSGPIGGQLTFTLYFEEVERVKGVLSEQELLESVPIIKADLNNLERREYRSYGFAIWTPKDCPARDPTAHLVVAPGYSKWTEDFVSKEIAVEKERFDNLTIETALSEIYERAETVIFLCGDKNEQRTITVQAGSIFSGYEITKKRVSLYAPGQQSYQITLPTRVIKITSMKKEAMLPEFESSSANLLVWSNRFGDAHNLLRIYTQPETGFVYIPFKFWYKNVHSNGTPATLHYYGLKAYYEGKDRIYSVAMFWADGTPSDKLDLLKKAFYSFRFLDRTR